MSAVLDVCGTAAAPPVVLAGTADTGGGGGGCGGSNIFYQLTVIDFSCTLAWVKAVLSSRVGASHSKGRSSPAG